MAQFRLINSHTEPITYDLALRFRDMKPSPTERDLLPKRLKALHEKAEMDVLVSFLWSYARLPGEAECLRTNGRTSSTMLCERKDTFPQGLWAHIDEYEVDDMDGLALLFRQFDAKESARSSLDISTANQRTQPTLVRIDNKIAKLSIEGVAWQQGYVDGIPTPSGDNRYSLFQKAMYHSFLLWAGDLLTSDNDEIRHTQVVAAMYGTFLANEAAARCFWSAVAQGGVDYEDDAPETVLYHWLHAAKDGMLSDQKKMKIKPASYFQACIYAWNASREERKLKDVRYDIKKGFYKPLA